MRAVLFHPLGVTLLTGSLLLAGILRFLPWAGALSPMAPGVLFLGAMGYTALAVALLWPGSEDPSPKGPRLDTDLFDEAVKKRLRSDAFRHPATLLPLALAVVSGCYLALLAFATVDRLAAIATLSIMVVVAAGSFLWHYTIHYRERYGAKLHWLTDMLEEEKTKSEKVELEGLRVRLNEGFPSLGSGQGDRAFRGLEDEFSKLRPFLEGLREAAPLFIMPVPALASETYHQGLKVLADALELVKAIHGPDRERLEAEAAEIEREIKSLEPDNVKLAGTLILEETLASHRQRLGMLEQLRLRADQLFHLAGRCEAALHRTRIEVAAIRAGGAEGSVNSVVTTLQDTVRRAKEVQEELRRLGY